MTKKKRVVKAWAIVDTRERVRFTRSKKRAAIDVARCFANWSIEPCTITLTPKRKKHKHIYDRCSFTLRHEESCAKDICRMNYCRCGKRKKK